MKKRIIISISLVVLSIFVVVAVIGVVVLYHVLEPTNVRDNRSASASKDMIDVSRKWGRLAEFPSTKKDFIIQTEGSMFTRSFRGSFSDTEDRVAQWLKDSPGIKEGRVEGLQDGSTKYHLKMGGGAMAGEVIVSKGGRDVTLYICWS
jgi:hypothetical protein